MLWRAANGGNIAAPGTAESLLRRAISEKPANPSLRIKLADLLLDRYDFDGAASALEAALAADADAAGARSRLGRCYNARGRHREALEILGEGPPDFERASAHDSLGRDSEAEQEYRALLAADPHHRTACRKLSKLLRRTERAAELLQLCESLSERGVRHGRLLYAWGTALALSGRHEEARALLFDRSRVATSTLPVPAGFADITEFNAALAEEILANPHRLSDFPVDEQANRGSSRVHALFAGRRPELVSALLDSVQRLVAAETAARCGAFDPWLDARPKAAHLKAWGLIQRDGDYEEWHSHPAGWLSGVYYLRVPRSVSAEGAGGGCIEFGPPLPVARALPNLIPVWRHAPREGQLLLAPSHYTHRTIPTGRDEYRISLAFDVVPDRG
jgi:tetratricopeptide (TPR) repeat protein